MQSIESLGIGFSDFAVMEALLHKGPQPVNTLGRRVGLTSGSITTAITRLETKHLVQRGQSMEDGRVFIVDLTRKGRRFIEQAFAQHAQRLNRAVSALTAAERRTLIGLLRKLGKSVPAPQK
jgi:MarR family 2-MHQ and catechol resistance regulon transcriptional repressor